MRGTRPRKAALGGVRMPHESPSVGDGYAASGEVKTYTLPPEEIDRIFGQAKPAEGKAPFKLQNPYQREANEKDMMLKADFERILPKEKYMELREQGYSDAKMLKELNLPFNAVYHLTRAKKEWGIPTPARGGKKKPAEEVRQAVKVDIEKPKAEPKEEVVIETPLYSVVSSRVLPDSAEKEDAKDAHCQRPDCPYCGDGIDIAQVDAESKEEITGLDAFRKYDALEAELIRLDVYVTRRDEVIMEMEKIKTALEAVLVVI